MATMVLAGAVFVGLVLAEVDFAEVWAHLRALAASGLALLLLVYALRTLVDATAWLLTIRTLPLTPRWICRVTGVLLAGAVLEKTTPLGGFGGEPMKVVVLKRFHGVSYTDATASLVLRRTTDVVALALFLPIAFYLGARAQIVDAVGREVAMAGLAALVAGAGLFFAAQRWRVFSRLRRWIDGRAAVRRRRRAVTQALDAIEGVESALVDFYRAQPLRVAGSLLAAVGEIVVGIAAVYLTFHLLDHPVTATQAVVLEAFVLFVTAVFFFVPANLGTQEGALVLGCGALFGSPALGVALAAIRRSRDLLWLLGGLLLGAYYSVAADAVAGTERPSTDSSRA
jgi:glycosyltransferase 2 family protein